MSDDPQLSTMVDYDPSTAHSPLQVATSAKLGGHGGLVIPKAQMASTSSIPVLNVKNRREGISDAYNHSAYLDAGWLTIHHPYLSCVLRGDPNLPASLQSAYELCVNICYNDDANYLYERVYSELESYYRDLGSLLSSMAGADDDFLGYLHTMWEENNEKMEKIRAVFIELERRYIIKHTPFRSLRELGIHLFYVNIVRNDPVKKRLILNVLFFIQQARNNCNIPDHQMKAAIKMMQEMNIYRTNFEPCLIRDTERFYENESTRILSRLNIPEYLQYVARRQFFEENLQPAIPVTTRMDMSAIVIDKFIRFRLNDILSKGYYTMLDSNDISSLKMLYTTITEQQKQLLRVKMVAYVKERFRSKVNEYQNEMKNISFIYKFKSKMENLIVNAFDKDVLITQAIADTFEDLVQSREPSIAVTVAIFIDKKMKSHKLFQSTNMDANLPDAFDGALTIFRSLADKDVFAGVYQRLLGDRLLSGTSNTRAETMMVGKLQSICGNDYMTQFTKMITDIEEWSENDDRYNALMKRDTGIDFHVRTVSHEAWTFAGTHNVYFDNKLQHYLTQYEAAFIANFKSRKVLWSHSLSKLSMEANLRFGTTPLIVNALHASVLTLFNRDKEMWEFDEIAQETNIDTEDLKDILRTMTCCPGALLLKDSPDPEYIMEQDTFSCNLNFHSNTTIDLYKAITMEGTNDMAIRKKRLPRMGDDREYKIDATIVRLMKQNRQLQHQELYTRTSEQLPFSISSNEFKARVELLIDKNMMKRQKKRSSTYVYLP